MAITFIRPLSVNDFSELAAGRVSPESIVGIPSVIIMAMLGTLGLSPLFLSKQCVLARRRAAGVFVKPPE